MMNESELRAAARAIAGNDHSAFRRFYDHFYLRIYRFVFAMLRDANDCEAVVSNLFCVVWEKRHLLEQVRSLEAYIYRIARNEAYHYLKKKSASHCISLEEMFAETAPAGESVIDTLTEQEMMQAYRTAVERLPERCRTVFLLVREERMSHKKVSELLGITPGTIEVQMNIAMKKIVSSIRAQYPAFNLACQR